MIVLTWRRESQSVVQRPAPREKAYRGSEKHQGGEARHYRYRANSLGTRLWFRDYRANVLDMDRIRMRIRLGSGLG